MDLYQISVPPTGEFCTVVTGRNRQTYLTTKAELIAALAADPAAERTGTGGVWMDLLATHGFAMKSTGQITTFAMLAPSVARNINYSVTGRNPQRFTLKFPPILFTFRFNGNRYQDDYNYGKAYLVDPAAATSLTVTYPSPCLYHFPFGNVFNHGGICWGGTNLTAFTPTNPQAVVDAFFDSPFNNHLWAENAHDWVDMPTMARTIPRGEVVWGRPFTVTPATVLGRL